MQLADRLPLPSGKAEDALRFGGVLLRIGLGLYGVYTGVRTVERELRNGHDGSGVMAVSK